MMLLRSAISTRAFRHSYVTLLVIFYIHHLFVAAAAKCKGTINYTVSFTYEWTLQNDPGQPPEEPVGFGRMHCASHNDKYVMWKPQRTASPAIQKFVDQDDDNSDEKLRNEIEPDKDNILSYNASIRDMVVNDESEDLILKISADFSLISCIAQLVPSPGWFVGIHSRDMCNETDEASEFVRIDSRALVGWISGRYNDTEYFVEEYTEADPPMEITQVTGKLEQYGEVNIRSDDFKESQESMRACFPAGELVTMADGSRQPIESISRNDAVASTDLETPSEIFMHSHADPHAVASFVHVQYADGEKTGNLRVSPGHYVYRRGQDSMPMLLKAADIAVGDFLIGADRLPKRVVQVSSVTGSGLFNPHSLNGDLIVSGVRVSCFTTAVKPLVASSAMAPLRLLHRIGSYRLQDLLSWKIFDYVRSGSTYPGEL
ncbi:unnamed protein product [Chondrus crispus]|uniref:Spondin domain-containing protein n=1 Tax=Chondrus crispus TaxID=2769 RepID=R7QQA1_CHOCR|nr:unnamed protein product [Chondrus crispus]CDF39545.1 unnamed protein product [Chondrus crispus]|eukprot:XP_005709839.1 unnamed protein product [Chondrus crispus]